MHPAGTAPFDFQWFFNGLAIDGATADTLLMTNVQSEQAGTYWVRVSNAFGSVESDGAQLKVWEQTTQGTISPLNLKDDLVYDGAQPVPAGHEFLVQVYGGPDPSDLRPVSGTARFIAPGRYFFGLLYLPFVSAGQTAWLQVRAWETAFGSNYEDALAAGGKTGTSTVVPLVVGGGIVPPTAFNPPGFEVSAVPLPPLAILTQPRAQTVPMGEDMVLAVQVSAGSNIHYQWLRDGQPLAGGINAVLTLHGAVPSESGEYQVVVTQYGQSITSDVARVTIERERLLALVDPPDQHEGSLVQVPLQLVSKGNVGGLSFDVRYDPAFLTDARVVWNPAFTGAYSEANLTAQGELSGVLALPATAFPTGTQTLAWIQFRARTVPEDLATPLTLEIPDLADPSGDPLVSGTEIQSGHIRILDSTVDGDNNGNDRLDAGDVSLILRLMTELDEVRPWDLERNDLNGNGKLDSGDAVKILRVVAGLDLPAQRQGREVTADPGRWAIPSMLSGAGNAMLSFSPARLQGNPGDPVTVQVQMAEVPDGVCGAAFVLEYPADALRLVAGPETRFGSIVPPQALGTYNEMSGTSSGMRQARFVTGSASTWPAHSGVLAELTFEVLPGATQRYLWPVRLSGGELTSNGYEMLPMAASRLDFIGRPPLPGRFALSRDADDARHWRFIFEGDPGARYVIEASSDLEHWTSLREFTQETDLSFFRDIESSPYPCRFYRARPAADLAP